MNIKEGLADLTATAKLIGGGSPAAEGLVVLLTLLGRILEGRTPEEAKEVLEGILAGGVTPITQSALSDQELKVLSALTLTGNPKE